MVATDGWEPAFFPALMTRFWAISRTGVPSARGALAGTRAWPLTQGFLGHELPISHDRWFKPPLLTGRLKQVRSLA